MLLPGSAFVCSLLLGHSDRSNEKFLARICCSVLGMDVLPFEIGRTLFSPHHGPPVLHDLDNGGSDVFHILLQARQKSRMLFGNQHFEKSRSMPVPAEATMIVEDTPEGTAQTDVSPDAMTSPRGLVHAPARDEGLRHGPPFHRHLSTALPVEYGASSESYVRLPFAGEYSIFWVH